ncbi:CvpA family protein [Pantoea sp. Aalb]|uniref:CvpA family protein n=1 Tax=Pantoea sp. Aalb TaxID=2576762 RepID=UPI001326B930|nr:CvpA family protein [Pantoea sp. Aalb]MXP67298.1 colicin V production protein [Pantoea sp. Aalb]
MIWIDYFIIGVIFFSIVVSVIRGFIQETLSCIIWICAFFISTHYYSYLVVWLTNSNDKLINNSIAIIIIFFTILIIGAIVNHVISSVIQRTTLSGIDRVLGGCFGALRGIIFISAIIFFLNIFTSFPKSYDWQQSKLIPQFNYMVKLFYQKIPSSFIPITPSKWMVINKEIINVWYRWYH